MNAHTPALVLLAICSLLANGCGGKLEEPQRFADLITKRNVDGGSQDGSVMPVADAGPVVVAVPACVTTIFTKTCGASVGCHDKTSVFLDLVSPDVTARLVDKDSTSDLCKDRPYVATDGAASLLLQKISPMPGCGNRMPIGQVLTPAQTKCLSDWVVTLGGKAGGT